MEVITDYADRRTLVYKNETVVRYRWSCQSLKSMPIDLLFKFVKFWNYRNSSVIFNEPPAWEEFQELTVYQKDSNQSNATSYPIGVEYVYRCR